MRWVTQVLSVALVLAAVVSLAGCYEGGPGAAPPDLGSTPRRKEFAILKACGWTTRDVLTLNLAENLLVAVAGAGLGALLAVVWLRVLDAPLLRSHQRVTSFWSHPMPN